MRVLIELDLSRRLSPEAFEKLTARAAKIGKPAEELAASYICDGLSAESTPAPRRKPSAKKEVAA